MHSHLPLTWLLWFKPVNVKESRVSSYSNEEKAVEAHIDGRQKTQSEKNTYNSIGPSENIKSPITSMFEQLAAALFHFYLCSQII